MIKAQANRWGGTALIVGGVLFIVNKFNDMSQTFLNNPMPDLITGASLGLLALGQIALVSGFFGCYLLYAGQSTRLGKMGLALSAGGSVLLALGHITFTPFVNDDPLFLLVILGVLGMVAGLILFGVMNLRRPILACWQALPLASGILGFVAFFLYGSKDDPVVFLSLRTLFGASLILLGIVMWRQRISQTAVRAQERAALT